VTSKGTKENRRRVRDEAARRRFRVPRVRVIISVPITLNQPMIYAVRAMFAEE